MNKNKRKLWFKIFLWAWLASIPLMLVVGFGADAVQRNFVDTRFPKYASEAALQAWENAPTPAIVVAFRMINLLVILYMTLGWIPVIIFGFLKEAKGKR